MGGKVLMIPPIKSWNDVGAEQKAPEARLENRGLEAGLEAPKSRPGRSKIEPRALQDTIFETRLT